MSVEVVIVQPHWLR